MASLAEQLQDPNPSARLRAALAAGSTPEPAAVEPLVARCAVEPDFFVRDMLTWALMRQSTEVTVPRLLEELASPFPLARSQALHTLSKIRDARAWPAVTKALLHDEEDEVARAAWRAGVVLVPAGSETALAAELAQELGRRDPDARRSLTRALTALHEAARPALDAAAESGVFAVRVHAITTLLILDDPQRDFGSAREAAELIALGASRDAAS